MKPEVDPYLLSLEKRWPAIDWRQPILLQSPSYATNFGCRICIARMGLRSTRIILHPQTQWEFEEHMRSIHGVA